jgi:DNA-binding transcriptional MerR regulator
MIRIGDFSKLSCVTVKTLRFYDEMGLLKPVEVDRFTGYRYYSYDQLPRLHRILALRDLGFSIESIGQVLEHELGAEQIHGMLLLRQAEIRDKMAEEEQRLQRVTAWLSQIEQEDKMSEYDVVIKSAEPIRVASIRGVVPTPPDQGSMWCELGTYLDAQKVKPIGACLTLYHDDEHREKDWDVEVCEPISDELEETASVKVRTLLAVKKLACTIHKGPFVTISQAYDAILKWINDNGYHICGPCREVYLESSIGEGSQTDPNTVTEIQFPVEK